MEKKNKNKSRFFFGGAPDAPEDQAICLFAGLLANPDMPLSHEYTQSKAKPSRQNYKTKTTERYKGKTPTSSLWTNTPRVRPNHQGKTKYSIKYKHQRNSLAAQDMKKILDNKVQVDTILLQPAEIFIILDTLKGQGDFNQMVITQFINL